MGLSVAWNLIGGEMVSVLITSSVVDGGLSPDWVKPKTIKLVLIASYVKLRSKGKDMVGPEAGKFVRIGDMSIRGVLFQWVSTIKIQLYI